MPTGKKYLGQHWLTSASVLRAMIDAAAIRPGETVLEIGPGRGVLTAALLAAGAKVVAIEKDQTLIAELKNKFPAAIKNKKLILINDDIRNFDPASLKANKLSPITYKLVSNIPYYLTGFILKKFLTATNQPRQMVLLVQKEVAERVVAKNGRASILSISVKIYGPPEYVKTVPAGAFSPPPQVASAILKIANINRQRFADAESEQKFFALVRKGFSHKRKKLSGNLNCSAIILEACGLGPNTRAENVTLDQWLCLTKELPEK